MTDTNWHIPKHSVALTIFLLALGAEIGALWGLFLAFLGATATLAAGGPLALLLAGPLLLATHGVGTVYVVFGVPAWALVAGTTFAIESSGDTGTTAKRLGVTFVSESHPINQTVQRMASELNLPPIPYVGWFDSDDINAFAMGTAHYNSLIAVSKGAIETLSREQINAVIAHELGHIASNDMQRMTYALGVRDSLTWFLIKRGFKKFARWVFTPLSELELLRFSRQREFTADAISAHLTSPEAMISVLETLKGAEIEPQTHHQPTVMMSASFDGSWLSTHPPLDTRIAALLEFTAPTSKTQSERAEPQRGPQGT
ncbi:M48 family metalloprotease [uncultured Roseibium sp.]|uniref:M48 family metalloprotease n=1 Tax=uncultured Roseibium sp. TaxID=1936171 RepID=UPI002606032B|nr:M48 family metalloprotease [uncultured Roseibium sp.]